MLRFSLVVLLLGAALSQNVPDDLLTEIFGQPGDQNKNNDGGAEPSPSSPAPTVESTTFRLSINPPQPTDQEKPSYAACTLETGEPGECVPYYLCGVNNTIIDDGKGIIDIRGLQDGTCVSYMEYCCGIEGVLTPEGGQSITTALPPAIKERQGCGWRNPTGLGFSIRGAKDGEAQFGEFPWMVAILELKSVDESQPELKVNVYVGGGSLIHPAVVLTAAHYVSKSKEEFNVRAGEWDTQTKNEPYPYQNRAVKEIVVHKDFNNQNLFYDIALLFLTAPMDPAPNIGVACLPPPKMVATSGTRCLASGWGKDKFGKDGRYQVILKRVEVPVVDRMTCQSLLRKTRLGRLFQLHRTFMCAGGERGVDTCRGDGGSPLVCPIEYETDRYVQHGIVAWGIGCGEEGTPGVYVDVATLRNWIDDEVVRRGYDVSTYSYR